MGSTSNALDKGGKNFKTCMNLRGVKTETQTVRQKVDYIFVYPYGVEYGRVYR